MESSKTARVVSVRGNNCIEYNKKVSERSNEINTIPILLQ